VQVHVGEEQLLPGQLDVMGDADVADMPAWASGADGLHHRLVRADCLDHRVCAEPVGKFLDLRHPVVAALDDDVGGAVLAGELLSWLVAAHCDDPLCAKLLGGQDSEQTDRPVAYDSDGLAWSGLCGHRAEPAGAQHIRGGEEAWDEVMGRKVRGGNQGAVGERDAHSLGLRAF